MPGPLDILKKGLKFATTPMVNADPIADAIDEPSLERSPMEAQVRGFGAGALQGLAGMTSPLELGAATLGGTALGGLRALGRLPKIAKAADPIIDIIESPAVRQVAPAMDDVDSLIGDLNRNLAKVPKSRPQAPQLDSRMPGFAPAERRLQSGAEYLGGRRAEDVIYDSLMPKMGGRGK